MSAKAQILQSLLSGISFAGVVANGYVVYFVDAGSAPSIASLKSIWLDANKTTPAANPYTLDSDGKAKLYLDGNYDIIVKDAVGGAVKDTWLGVNINVSDVVTAFNVDTRDCFAGDFTVTPVAANNAGATVILYRKDRSDTSGNALIIAPISGTVNGLSSIALTLAGESALLVPIADENDYMVM